MKQKVILYLSGGAIAGVFGAGVVTGLQKRNLYNKIERIYAGSAGVFNGAYFISQQSELGSRIYWEDLPNRFFSMFNAVIKIFSPRKAGDVLNINYLMNVAKKIKVLDIGKIRKSKIPLYAHLYDINKNNFFYEDVRKNTLKTLKKAVSPIPWVYSSKEKIVDGEIIRPIGYERLKRKHPNQKIIFVLNYTTEKSFLRIIKETIENWLAHRIYKSSSLDELMKKRYKIPMIDGEKIRNDKNSLIIENKNRKANLTTTSNKKEIIKTYKLGIKESKKIADFLKR